METENLGMSNQDELQSPAADITPDTSEIINGGSEESATTERRHRQKDHSVSRKYRMFSNHSSANDMPHTNTSF